jgi:hypothetical protein
MMFALRCPFYMNMGLSIFGPNLMTKTSVHIQRVTRNEQAGIAEELSMLRTGNKPAHDHAYANGAHGSKCSAILSPCLDRVSNDEMSFSRSERCQESFNGALFTSCHALSICCNTAMHRSNLLIHSRKCISEVSKWISFRFSRTFERSSFAGPNWSL